MIKTDLPPANLPKTRWLILPALLLVLMVTTVLAGDAAAATNPVRFTNLTNQRVYIAKATYDPGCMSCGALKFAKNPSVTLNGWYYLEPGKTRTFPAGYYHLTHRTDLDGNFGWSGFPDQTLLIHPTNGFRDKRADLVEQPDGSLRLDFSRHTNASNLVKYEGFKTATYEKIDQGHLSISGSKASYKISSKTFNYDFQSHGSQTHKSCYQVSGNVAGFRWDANQRWVTGLIWDELSDEVCITVITEGRQTKAFGPREKSYFTGWLEVFYTVPR